MSRHKGKQKRIAISAPLPLVARSSIDWTLLEHYNNLEASERPQLLAQLGIEIANRNHLRANDTSLGVSVPAW